MRLGPLTVGTFLTATVLSLPASAHERRHCACDCPPASTHHVRHVVREMGPQVHVTRIVRVVRPVVHVTRVIREERPVMHETRIVREAPRTHESSYYDYSESRTLREDNRSYSSDSSYGDSSYASGSSYGDVSQWQVAPNDGQVYGSCCAAGSGSYYGQGYSGGYQTGGYGGRLNTRGWTGGVGYASGAGGGFVDGYGQMHWGGGYNGPTYNSYGQSFQYNSSVAGPFRSHGMAGGMHGR